MRNIIAVTLAFILLMFSVPLSAERAPKPTPQSVTLVAAPSTVGSTPDITCPAGAVDIWPGVDINLVVVANPGNTAFCLRAGVHPITYATTPRTGDTFTGEYGAILDGSTWNTSDGNAAVFQNINAGITGVAIRNLVIRNMPQNGTKVFDTVLTSWVIEYNDISTCATKGVQLGKGDIARHNKIHHNPNGNYAAYRGDGAVFEDNEIADGGNEQKIVAAANVVFRRNWVHHNLGNGGIWYDTAQAGGLIENNLVEDNSGDGIAIEATPATTVRNNTVRRSAITGIFVSISRDVEIYGNTLSDNYRGVHYFVDPALVTATLDLIHVHAHDNAITIPGAGGTSGAWGGSLSFLTAGTSANAPYVTGLKDLTFQNNHYAVSNASGAYWFWGASPGKTFTQWQALPQDVTGTLNSIGTTPTPTTEPPPTSPDTLAPTVTMKPPTRSGKSSNFSVTATATDNVGVTSFALSIDGQVFANQPGTYTVKITAAGPHTFKAEAKDAAGNTASTTQPVTR